MRNNLKMVQIRGCNCNNPECLINTCIESGARMLELLTVTANNKKLENTADVNQLVIGSLAAACAFAISGQGEENQKHFFESLVIHSQVMLREMKTEETNKPDFVHKGTPVFFHKDKVN